MVYLVIILVVTSAMEAVIWSPLFFRMPYVFAPNAWVAYRRVMGGELAFEGEGYVDGMCASTYNSSDGRYYVTVFKANREMKCLGIFRKGTHDVVFSDVWNFHARKLYERIEKGIGVTDNR